MIVPQRNPTLPWADIQCKVKWDRRAPKPQYRWSFPQINLHTVTTLNQYLHIFSKVFLIVRTMPRPTPMGIRHEVFALASEGIKQGAIAARVGLTRAPVNRILKRHAATGSLVLGKSSGAPRKTTPRQDRALLRMVRQDRFLSARALTARMRNLYGMRTGRTTVNNRLLSRGYRAYRPTMMTSSNGNIFRVTGHLCGEFTGLRWIPRTKASDAELWCFLWCARN